ncbi:transposable element Tc1 transposase [Trichonephila clavipes]|nr:transposable element Tc1 transposase [Trichonephila clavipes]
MRPLEDARKNWWTMAEFSVRMVAVDLGPQQIDCWNKADWERIVFSDELRLCPDDHRRRIWRRPRQRADPAFTIARHTVQPRFMLAKHFLEQPDHHISPMKHVWDMMGRRLYLPGNVEKLPRQLEQIWQEIPQETIRVLHHSMPRRVPAYIQARSGSTPY